MSDRYLSSNWPSAKLPMTFSHKCYNPRINDLFFKNSLMFNKHKNITDKHCLVSNDYHSSSGLSLIGTSIILGLSITLAVRVPFCTTPTIQACRPSINSIFFAKAAPSSRGNTISKPPDNKHQLMRHSFLSSHTGCSAWNNFLLAYGLLQDIQYT